MRDKKESWVHIAKAWRNGKSAEELHGILFWQVKNMLLIKKSEGISATSLGLNPFVHKKAEAAAKKFTEEELEAMSSKLASVLYESRRQGSDSQIALEQFVLSVL
jgi:DNA polymerase III delta subunit